jgi:4-hydroxy-2-oxoheptanedioate aldolase
MRENRIRSIWKTGGAVVNGWLTIPSTFSAETMAHQGWDSLTIDLQHGLVDYQKAVDMFAAISTTDTVPMARVPWNEPGILMKVLDAGAYALICPMVNTRADAERLMSAAHYPPRGTRSFGPLRAMLYGGDDYQAQANDTVVIFAMIETREALEHLEDILSVPGLESIYVGPSDLSLALGCGPSMDDVERPVAEAIDHILARAKAHGVVAGIHNASPEAARKRIEKGFQFVTIGSDAGFMAEGSRQAISIVRSGAVQPASPGSGY